MSLLCEESVGEFSVVRAPFSRGPDNSQSCFFAFTTLAQRTDGSRASFREGIDEQARRELEAALFPLSLTWLSLQHADRVFVGQRDGSRVPCFDAAIVETAGCAIAFTTADCLPIVLVSKSQGLIAGIHAGWRGIAKEVIENCCKQFILSCGGSMPGDTQAWIGPSIGSADYEVDGLTKSELLAGPQVLIDHFSPTSPGHFLADLPAIARAKLDAAGIPAERIFAQQGSTLLDARFHSARRDGEPSGRMATVTGKT